MRSTLFYIPHADSYFEIPLFGVGWLLALLILVSLVLLVLRVRRHGWDLDLLRESSLYLLLGAAIIWGAPMVEEQTAAGDPLGIPIRGYGVMVLAGIVLSVMLLVHESQRMGLHPDLILSLAFWMVVAGFVGARIFYVIEFWPQFSAPTIGATLRNIGKLTDGGLVVYGSFIGASLTVLIFVGRHRLPLLAIADLLGPGLMLGLAFGRIGCFMNGCCWGGLCEESNLGITFPQGSPAYVDQIKDGSLLDMRFEHNPDDTYSIVEVHPSGLGDRAGLKAGDTIQQIFLPLEADFNRLRHGEKADEALMSITLRDGPPISWKFGDLPKRSAPVYPVQVISSINAALICLFLWAYYPFRRRDGEIAALLATIYPTTRILLESIRIDEPPMFMYELFTINIAPTISQTISAVLLLGVVGLWIYILSRPKGRALPLTA